MTSTGENGTTHALLNLHRKDHDQIDQHPLWIVVSSTGRIDSVHLIDHARHEGRTQYIQVFFNDSSTCIIAGCTSTSHSNIPSTGYLADLMGTTNAAAFTKAFPIMARHLSTTGTG
jgi:hypothetical protein